MIGNLFNEILFRPLLNILIFFYNTVAIEDLGIAIVLLTILIRLILVPLTAKMLRSQKEMAKVQPELKAIQKKHKGNQQKIGEETMKLYQAHNINPFSGCLPLLVQLPIIWALYRVFIRVNDTKTLDQLYGFIPNPGELHHIAFGFLDLTSSLWILAVIAASAQFIQARITMRAQQKDQTQSDNPTLQMTQKMMTFFPIMILVIAWNLPAGLVLYWVVTTLFSILEHTVIRKRLIGTGDAENNQPTELST